MHRRILFAAAVICCLAVTAAAQTGFTYGDAKAHQHPTTGWMPVASATGYFSGIGFADDPTNIPEDQLYGNTVCLVDIGGQHCYWYRWWKDPEVRAKQARWRANYPWQWITVTYDPECGLAFTANDAF